MTHSKITAKLNDQGELVFLAYKEPEPEILNPELCCSESHYHEEIKCYRQWQQSAVEYRAFDGGNVDHIGIHIIKNNLWEDLGNGSKEADVTDFVEIVEMENSRIFAFYKPQEPLSGVNEGKEESQSRLLSDLISMLGVSNISIKESYKIHALEKFTIKRK